MQIWIDLLRVAIPMGLVFGLLPALVGRCGHKSPPPWHELLVSGLLRSALFVELSALFMGKWQLYRPGMVFALYAGWIISTAVLSSRKFWLYNRDSDGPGYGMELRQRLLLQIERSGSFGGMFKWKPAISRGYLFLGLLMSGAFLHFLWNPLHNFRFLTTLGYSQTLSLGALVNGAPWNRDGSIALLAPIVVASGLDPATVLRLSVPLIYGLILCAIALCTISYSKSPWAAFLAVTLFWLYTRGPGLDAATAADGTLWACLFLLLASVVGPKSLGYAYCGMLLAWLSAPSFPELFPVAIGCVFVALVLNRYLVLTPLLVRKAGIAILVLASATTMTGPLRSYPLDGPLQYESSARAAAKIAREFSKNQWLIVSPMHEVAYSYGRGWHTELPQFLEEFPIAKVADKAFHFPYEVRDVFVFIEKKPLAQASNLAIPGNSLNSYYYSTNPGRASMEFRTAELIAAYAATHENISVYLQDQYVMVYRISQ